MILSAIAEKLKRRSKNDFKGRHFAVLLTLRAVSWYLLERDYRPLPGKKPDSRRNSGCASLLTIISNIQTQRCSPSPYG